jgi:hypothetical protein
LQEAARNLAVDILEKERAAAAEYGLGFSASSASGVLRHVAVLGFGLELYASQSFIASPLYCPREALFGLLDAKKGQSK